MEVLVLNSFVNKFVLQQTNEKGGPKFQKLNYEYACSVIRVFGFNSYCKMITPNSVA